MLETQPKSNTHRNWEPRQIITALGILLLTFGVLGWQWRAFNQRHSETLAENQSDDQSAEIPPLNTHWHEAQPKVRLAVATCIRGQLDAFRNGKYELGLQYHTRAIQRQMPSPEGYRQLMQTRYPVLTHQKRATFRFVNTDKERRFANAGLTIIGKDGAVMEAVYQLAFQDKQWLISGIAKRPPQSRSSQGHSSPQKPKKP